MMLELSDWDSQTGHGACKRAGGGGVGADVRVARFEFTLMERPTKRNDKDQQTLKHGTHIAASTSNANNTACDLLQVLAEPMLTYQ